VIPVVILPVAVVVIGLRLWRRRRRGTGSRPLPTAGGLLAHLGDGGLGDVGVVAEREVTERVRGRVFRVSTLLILVGVAAAIVIPVLTRSKGQPEKVGVVGAMSASLRATVVATAGSIGTDVQLVPERDRQAAQGDLRSSRIDLALVDGRQLVVNKAAGSGSISATDQLAGALAATLGANQALEAAGLTAAQAAQVVGAKPLPVTSLRGAPAKASPRGASVVGLILVFVMLTQYNTWTLIGVMEEKSSRVVEVLLAAVRPGQLLAGKVLGIGLVAFAQASLIVAFALGLGAAVGSDLLKGTGPLEAATTLVWLVLGYAFYSWVYAAAGSMAERQDQVQSLVFPLTLPIIFGYVVSLSAAGSANPSTLLKVLAYVPLTAPFAMPVLVGLGQATWWEFAASVVVSVGCTVGVAKLAVGIYRKAILRTGRRVRVREVLTRAAT
jgi:ABC-2 type transport system permease protein